MYRNLSNFKHYIYVHLKLHSSVHMGVHQVCALTTSELSKISSVGDANLGPP